MSERHGVLALQGDVREHLAVLRGLDADAVEVRRPEDLEGLAGIVLPGGESTTVGRLLERYGLLEPLRERLRDGMPAFGTCAGAILLARTALRADGRASDQPLLGVLDVTVRRNAFGRQVASFSCDLDIAGIAEPVAATFIRAPWIEEAGPGVEVLASVDGHPVVVRQGRILASAFHPELSGDPRLHRLWLDLAAVPA